MAVGTLSLPTEAQWEYACRAGTTGTHYAKNKERRSLSECAVYLYGRPRLINKDGDSIPQSVGTKMANAWGVYDMLGNVEEWCNDKRIESSWPKTSFRVYKGGHAFSTICRAAKTYRLEEINGDEYIGLRLCLKPLSYK